MDGLALFLVEEFGRPLGARLVQRVLGGPQERRLARVVDAALASPRLAGLAPEAERARFLAVVRERPGVRPGTAGGVPPGATALHELIRRWVAPLDEPVAEWGHQGYLDLHGIDPGRVVTVLHDEILAGLRADAAAGGPLRDLFAIIQADGMAGDLAAIRSSVVGRPPAGSVARVAAVDGFTGRATELADLVARLTGPPPDVVPVVAVHGSPGIGKSALVRELGRHPDVVGRYPDGVVLADLLGWTDGMEPPDEASVLAHLLDRAGVPDPGDGLERRLPAWRGWLAGRRVLVILDNARDERQVRHLVPDQPGCALVVTSRERLGQLPGAVRALGPLAAADAAELLRSLAGSGRLDDAAATARILTLCGGWPLAIRLAAGIFRNDADATPAEVAQALTEATAAELDPMMARLRVSYERLDDELRWAFGWVAWWDGAELTPFAAGLLLDRPADDAVAVLRRLARAELLLRSGPSRWRLHDLVRAFAASVHGQDVPWASGYLVARRVLAGYLAAMERPGAADEWLLVEAGNIAAAAQPALVAATALAESPPADDEEARGDDRLARRAGFRDGAELRADATRMAADGFRLAELGARRLVPAGRAAAAMQCVDVVHFWRRLGFDRYVHLLEHDVVNPLAVELLPGLIEQNHADGRPMIAGRLQAELGTQLLKSGDPAGAAVALEAALSTARQLGDRPGELTALIRLGDLSAHVGDPDHARLLYAGAVAVHDELDEAFVDPVTGRRPAVFAEAYFLRERLRAPEDG